MHIIKIMKMKYYGRQKIILPEDRITDNNRCENLSSYTVLLDVLYVREMWNYFDASNNG
jgi:hypothetical protein